MWISMYNNFFASLSLILIFNFLKHKWGILNALIEWKYYEKLLNFLYKVKCTENMKQQLYRAC